MIQLTITYIDGSSEDFKVDQECWEALDDDRPESYWLRLYGDDLAVLIRTETIRTIAAV